MGRRAAGADDALKAPNEGRAVWKVVCMVAIDNSLDVCFGVAKRELLAAYILLVFHHCAAHDRAKQGSSRALLLPLRSFQCIYLGRC